jgi:aminoglycoside/choline kinase family phosphotransferase
MGSLDAGSPEFAPYVAQLLNLDDSWRVSDRPVGNGQVAQCRRFEFVRGDDTVSVISKSPSADQTSRDTARLQHLYRRETSFYRELRPLIATRTPLPLHVEHHDDDSFLLLLEDLTPSTAVDQFSGLTIEQTAAALHELAGLHGPTAQRADLFAWPWLGGVATDLQPLYDAVLPGLFNQFLERYAEMIDNETRRTVRSLRDQLGGLSSFEPSLRTVVHGDYRSENLIIDGRNGDVPLAVVDWQTVSVSSPMLDVAYLITTSLDNRGPRDVRSRTD